MIAVFSSCFLFVKIFNGVNFYHVTRMHSADYAVARCLSVRLSVRPTHTGIVCKRLHMSSKFFHHQVATPF